LLDRAEGKYYGIDEGSFASDFTTKRGGISSQSLDAFKEGGLGYRTYEEDVIYSIVFKQLYYVP